MSNEASLDKLQQKIESLKLSSGSSSMKAELLKRLEFIRDSLPKSKASDNPQKDDLLESATTKKYANNGETLNINHEELLNFKSEIIKNNSLMLAEIQETKDSIKIIQQTTGFRAGPSLQYEGIQESVRRQLITDNLRMENALLDTNTYQQFGEELAFRRFCVFAFYQVEELLNLYYHTKYGDDIKTMRADWLTLIPKVTFSEKANSLTEISTGTKIFAYRRALGGGETLDSLRHVRNMEEHRCTTVLRRYGDDLPKLQVQYDRLRLPEKKAASIKKGETYEKSSEDKELENRLYAIRFLTEPASNAIIVRGALKRLYEAIITLNKTDSKKL